MSVAMMRAPEAPIGCPSAVPPPLTFSFSAGIPSSFMAIIGTIAKGFVDFEQIDIGYSPAGLFHRTADRRNRSGREFCWFLAVRGP
jgi:hypothetical protein